MTWSVCIFAHNEERLLPRCLAALDGAAADPRIHVHELPVSDKSNAWNEYVHRIAGEEEMHVFIDGDVQPSRGAFKSFAHAFSGSPEAYAAAGLPLTGRSRKAWALRLLAEHYLSGNLYAFSGRGLDLLRSRNIRLPFGSVGEDGLLSYMLLTDLKGGRDDSHRERIAVAAGAFFEYDSLGVNFRDLATYRRRLRRYSKRYFQNQILYALLKEKGLSALPERIAEIYTPENVARLAPRIEFPNYFVDLETLRALKLLTGGARRRPQ